ncbi:MAG: hypothetical protein V6S10_04800 [Candidatus Methanoglobus sp.]
MSRVRFQKGALFITTHLKAKTSREVCQKRLKRYFEIGIIVRSTFMRRCGNFAPYVNRYVLDLKYLWDL